jgi:hypothetical protein
VKVLRTFFIKILQPFFASLSNDNIIYIISLSVAGKVGLKIVRVLNYISRPLKTYDNGAVTPCILNPLNAKLNPICHLLALLGAHHILHFSRISAKLHNRLNRMILSTDRHYYSKEETDFETRRIASSVRSQEVQTLGRAQALMSPP